LPRLPQSMCPLARLALVGGLGLPMLYLTTGLWFGSPWASLISIYIAAFALGKIVGAFDIGLPPLLGMLIAGFCLTNLPWGIGENVGARLDPAVSSLISKIALALILCRAGTELDLDALSRMRWVIARVAILPCLFEATAVAATTMVLFGFPLGWAYMTGFTVAAVSPAVVVPSLLALQKRGYGTSTGIPTVVCAAAALDDVASIGGFTISMSLAISFHDEPLWKEIVKMPLEILAGIAIGGLGAFIVVLVTPARLDDASVNEQPKARGYGGRFWRASLLVLVALACSLALNQFGFKGASAFSSLVISALASLGWGQEVKEPVAVILGAVWNGIAAPLLFGLVGASVSLDWIQADHVALGLLVLVICLPVRGLGTFLAMSGRGLRFQDKLFTALAWCPKATVQATVGPLALQAINAHPDSPTYARDKNWAEAVLTIAVLSILLTAPLGSALISMTGPRLLLCEDVAGDDYAESGVGRKPSKQDTEILTPRSISIEV